SASRDRNAAVGVEHHLVPGRGNAHETRDKQRPEWRSHGRDRRSVTLGRALDDAAVDRLHAPLAAAAPWAERTRREHRLAARDADGDREAHGASSTTAFAHAP